MKKLTIVIATLGMLAPTAYAEIDFSGEAYLGYGNAAGGEEPGTEKGLAVLDLMASERSQLDNGHEFYWRARLRGRSDREDISGVDNRIFDGEISYDMEEAGTITVTSFNEENDRPWADGEIMNRGSVSVHPVIRKTYRSVEDSIPISVGNGYEVRQPDILVQYGNSLNNFFFEANAAPLGTYGGADADERVYRNDEYSEIDARIGYKFENVTLSYRRNDLQDNKIEAHARLAQYGLYFGARYETQNDDSSIFHRGGSVSWRPKNMGYLKSISYFYGQNDMIHNNVLSVNVGGNRWRVGLATDRHSDWAIEGAYDVNERLQILAGIDSGHDFREGFDPAYKPPVSAPERGDSFEVGVRMKF
ncbi:hypothetical protein [Halomonas sp. BL6]|uniref:hypothetical protein n=1 Tax=Halomonas sp. BL6 TaxID=2585770 RepID=UPI001117F4A6|nr:hypothetical protein [Halomonas sp. BL6]TNH14109.1 hypothetical protein FHJ80_15535 [Halomonas sp. BL6]